MSKYIPMKHILTILLYFIVVFSAFTMYSSHNDLNERIVLNKILPPSPSNLDKDVDVTIEFTVMPDGTVGDMRPATKGDPALESISLKTLKKWRFNAIDTDITMRGKITFSFKGEGGLETRIVNTLDSESDSHISEDLDEIETTAQSKQLLYKPIFADESSGEKANKDIKDLSKYYAVSHGSWGSFMNNHAVWIDNMELCHEGISKILYFTTPELESGLYEFEIAADDNAELFIDNEKVTSFSSFGSSEKFKMKLEKGIHEIRVVLQNIVLSKTNWIENAVGTAIVIRNAKNEIVLSSRDTRFCHRLFSTPITYPMNKGVKLMIDQGVWINYLGSLEVDKPIEINWEFDIKEQGVYSFHMQADNEAEIYVDGQLIEKVTDWATETITKVFLEKGEHSLKTIVINRPGEKESWDSNPGGIAIMIKNKAGVKIFGSRDYASPIPEHLKVKNSSIQENKVTEVTTIQNQLVEQKASLPGNSTLSIADQFMEYLTRSNWIVTEYEPSFAKAYYRAKCRFTKSSFHYIPMYDGKYLGENSFRFEVISIQDNIPEGTKYAGAFRFYSLQQNNPDPDTNVFVYLKENVVLWKSSFRGYTVNLVLTRY